MHSHAGLQVLAARSLFSSIVAFACGVPFFALQVKRQLKCTLPPPADKYSIWRYPVPPQDIEFWQNAVLTDDKRTLEALHVLAATESATGEKVRRALKGIVGYALLHSHNTTLLDWIDANKMFGFDGADHLVHFALGEQGDLAKIRWMIERGRLVRPQLASGAASSGHLEVLQYLHSVGPAKAVIADYAVVSAVKNGHLHIVRLLHKNGYACWNYAFDIAAGNGHLDIVKFLHENHVWGYKSLYALDAAAKNGHLEVIQFLRKEGYACSQELQ